MALTELVEGVLMFAAGARGADQALACAPERRGEREARCGRDRGIADSSRMIVKAEECPEKGRRRSTSPVYWRTPVARHGTTLKWSYAVSGGAGWRDLGWDGASGGRRHDTPVVGVCKNALRGEQGTEHRRLKLDPAVLRLCRSHPARSLTGGAIGVV